MVILFKTTSIPSFFLPSNVKKSTRKVQSELSDVDTVEVICSECSVAFGALPLASVIASLQAFIAEDVETLGEDRLLITSITTGATQFSLILINFFLQNLISIRVHLNLLLLLQLAPQSG